MITFGSRQGESNDQEQVHAPEEPQERSAKPSAAPVANEGGGDNEPSGDSAKGGGEAGHDDHAAGHGDHASGQDGAAHEHAGHREGHGHEDLDWSSYDVRKDHFLGSDHLVAHVQDQPFFEFPSGGPHPIHIPIWNPLQFTRAEPAVAAPQGQLGKYIGPTTFQPTKFVVLELVAAVLIAAIFIPYARRIRNGERPVGKFWNMIDTVVCYVKEQIAEPAIGKSDSRRFLPLLWTLFFFVLTLNLLGMVPGLGAATGSIAITASLALVVFGVVVGSGTKKMGVLGFWKAQVPHMELHWAMALFLVPMIWMIEVFGLFVKHVVLAVRLFANMFAGHMVVAVIVAFVGVIGTYWAGVVVGPAALAVNVLELLVAFIQAYVFTFLSALFIGAAVHPH